MVYINSPRIILHDQQYIGDNISKLIAKNKNQNMELVLQTPHSAGGYTYAHYLVFKPVRII
jgi:hypothetical protein